MSEDRTEKLLEIFREDYEDVMQSVTDSDMTVASLMEMVVDCHARGVAVAWLRDVLEAQTFGILLTKALKGRHVRDVFRELFHESIPDAELDDLFHEWDRMYTNEMLMRQLDNYIFDFSEEDDGNTGEELKSTRTVPLRVITEGIEMADDMWNQYLDLETMQLVSMASTFNDFADSDDRSGITEEDIEEGWLTRFFRLPSQRDIHEYHIMEEFIDQMKPGDARNRLARAISGRGAFRRFKDAVIDMGIADKWYDYLHKAHEEIAAEWCRENGLHYAREDEK
ncbi:MAG: hypothetical protein J6S26_00960 [Solobacterium sp.]|nr:hypothetical protein [Solobacterium sp.]